MQRILILAANPLDSSRLRLDKELREIEAVLSRAKQRDRFDIRLQYATRPSDIQQALLDYNPQIVHFCGHGDGAKGLIFEDDSGRSQFVSARALANLFELFADQVKCVVLNACYSDVQAAAIVAHVDAVIGMNQPIGDTAAIRFAEGFYRGLGAGRDVEFAYRLGRNALELQGIAQEHIPVLKRKAAEVLGTVQPEQPKGDQPIQQGPSRKATVVPDPSVSGSSVPNPSVPNPSVSEPVEPEPVEPSKRSRIFISYKRDVEPDEPVAREICAALQVHHDVFIDRKMLVGTPWAERIEAELKASDVLIVLLSAHSVHSEMVEHEVELAHRFAKAKSVDGAEDGAEGVPRILPVRLAYRQPFQYPLSEYLNPLNWAMWTDAEDTAGLIAELLSAIAGTPLSIAEAEKPDLLETNTSTEIPNPASSAQPVPLESPDQGTMALESRLYIRRVEDDRALRAVDAQEGTVIIKGARQMGKSSLLNRMMAGAVKQDRHVVFLDFQLFDQPALENRERFFRQFCTFVADELELPNRLDDYWDADLPLPTICTSYMGRYLLKGIEEPIVLAMDEVDRVLNTGFRSDFFGMLRGWHNKRATSKPWRKFSQVLVISTEPYQLIEDLNQSPFNVGQTLRLQDFTLAQVAELNGRHGNPLGAGELDELMRLLAGHPYLVRLSLYLLATGEYTPASFFEAAGADQGPFGGHLRRHLFRLQGKENLTTGLKEILRNNACADEQLVWRLEGAGLVKRDGTRVLPRCELYTKYFRQHLS
ncbi:MAG: AAA-like domain-containing protein [Phormidesmis sp.]